MDQQWNNVLKNDNLSTVKDFIQNGANIHFNKEYPLKMAVFLEILK